MHTKGVKMQNNSIKSKKKIASTYNTLKFFVLNKEGTTEDVATFVEKDYTTALRNIKKLLRADAITLERVEGRQKKVYRIMLHGLFTFMIIDKNTATSHFHEIVKAHVDRLLSFKKYEYFKSKSLGELIAERFFNTLRSWATTRLSLFQIFSDMEGQASFPRMHSDQNTAWAADADILGVVLMAKPVEYVKQVMGEEKWSEHMKLFKAVEEDYELRLFKEEALFRFEMRHKEALDAISKWRTLPKEFSKKA